MKYFTPELYVKINNASDDEAEALHDRWDRLTKRYRRRYKKIEPQLPPALRKFHDEQCLHDADWCGIARLSPYTLSGNSQDVTVVVAQENTLIPEFLNTLAILQYTVTAPPVLEWPVDSSVFSSVQPIWLYDEIDVAGPGEFTHSILVSNGLVVTIHFREFRYLIAPLLTPARNGRAAEGRPAAEQASA